MFNPLPLLSIVDVFNLQIFFSFKFSITASRHCFLGPPRSFLSILFRYSFLFHSLMYHPITEIFSLLLIFSLSTLFESNFTSYRCLIIFHSFLCFTLALNPKIHHCLSSLFLRPPRSFLSIFFRYSFLFQFFMYYPVSEIFSLLLILFLLFIQK